MASIVSVVIRDAVDSVTALRDLCVQESNATERRKIVKYMLAYFMIHKLKAVPMKSREPPYIVLGGLKF